VPAKLKCGKCGNACMIKDAKPGARYLCGERVRMRVSPMWVGLSSLPLLGRLENLPHNYGTQ
jgi:hypothetical protein